MVHRDFVRPADAGWFKKARAAKRALLAEYARAEAEQRDPDPKIFRPSLWGELKEHLKAVFKRKCAYCEAHFDHVDFGDVEHYRPKKRLDEIDEQGNHELVDGHRGYFWLAYSPRNLLPSCKLCNGPGGKMNLFPLEDPTKRVFRPGGRLREESPLLLNPYKHYPEEDLEFQDEGFVEAITDRGAMSLEVYRLNRGPLVKKRKEAQEYRRLRLWDMFSKENDSGMMDEIETIYAGEVEYSASVRAEIEPFLNRIEKVADRLKLIPRRTRPRG